MTLTRTRTHTHVLVHAWASTSVIGRDEHPEMTGMPRDGDPCSIAGCHEPLRKGEEAIAPIELERDDRAVESWGEPWCGYDHPTHKTWRDGDGL